MKKYFCFVLFITLASGCAAFGGEYAWQNSKYQRGSNDYKSVLSSDRDECSQFAFKEGVRIDGVTYYDFDSARKAAVEYEVKLIGVQKVPSYRKQYNYMESRLDKCMAKRGWYFVKIG